jgi:hypothetical protein
MRTGALIAALYFSTCSLAVAQSAAGSTGGSAAAGGAAGSTL